MKRFFCSLLICIFLFISSSAPANAEDSQSDIAIVFTHDLHSHISPFSLDGESVGGFARIKSVIDNAKSQHSNTLVLDAGDFSMGTLYQTAFTKAAIEYRMLGALGYDAITFGNHEFDYGFNAVKEMISAAKNSGEYIPPILCANIDTESSGLNDKELSSLNIKKYEIIKKDNYTIAVFGLLGEDASGLSSSSGLTFQNYITAAENTVAEISNLYSPDLIICLSHTGTGENVNDEDVRLAESVKDIDIIISGHTHTKLATPIIVGDTIIASCGEYGEYVGEILLKLNEGKVELDSYSLTKINSYIPENEEINKVVEEFNTHINNYLSPFGYNSENDILAYSPFDFPEQSSMSDSLAEQQLGNLISDSYIHAIKKAEGDNYIPVDVAVAPNGVIRASIDKGNVTVAQAFEISSLGIGTDGTAGYPLCSVYLYGYELWNLAEVDASVSGIMSYAQLYCSGLGYSVNTNRMFLNRVYDCWLIDENGNRIEIVPNKLYRIISGMSSAQMLGTVKSKSFGLLELTPKDAHGNVITDFNKHIAIDSNGAEVKEWKALADYLSSFPKNNDGISVIPEKYTVTEGRKNIYDTFDFSQIFIKWNAISCLVCFVLISLVVLIVILFVSIIKRVRKNKRNTLMRSEEIDI